MVSSPTTPSPWWRAARPLACAAASAAIGLVAATPAAAAARRVPPPAQDAEATESPATVVRVLLPAMSRKWPLELLFLILGHPTLVAGDSAEPRARWLVHSRHDRRLVVEVAANEVTAALLTVRTMAGDAYGAALTSMSDLLGPPRRAGPHDAWWSGQGVDVRLAGWRGEFNLEVRRRRGRNDSR